MIKLDYIKITNFCSSKATKKGIKTQLTERTFAIHISNKRLLSRICKELLQINKKKNGNVIEIGKRLEQISYKREYLKGQYTFEKVLNFIIH